MKTSFLQSMFYMAAIVFFTSYPKGIDSITGLMITIFMLVAVITDSIKEVNYEK